MMERKPRISRRQFVAGTTVGLASLGFRLPAWSYDAGDYLDNEAAGTELEILRLDRNESSYGLPPSVVEAIQRAVTARSNRYPGDETRSLAEAIAQKFGFSREQVLLGCGSTEILNMATGAFCDSSRTAVVAEPTFEAVVSYCPLVHARAVQIPVTKDYQHDLPRMLQSSAQGGGLVFFCNPSNPTGTFLGKREVEEFVRKVPRSAVLLADEAYWDYVNDPDWESCLRYVKEGLPVVVSRTFSKVYGMAGLRVGYAIGREDLIKRMSERRLANNPNQLATAAAVAALKEDAFVANVRRLNAEVRDYVCGELRSMGLECIPSQTNFVTIHMGRPAKPLIEELKTRRVRVGRLFSAIPNHMRVSLGTKEEMGLFLQQFKELPISHSQSASASKKSA